MDLGLNGRVALVTGASKGLGRAVATELAREGADVAINSRSAEALAEAAAAIEAETGKAVLVVPGDVSQAQVCTDIVARTVDHFGRLDILVPNAGGPPPGGVDDFGPQAYREALELNLMSTVQLTLAALPEMRKNGWGRVVAITSVAVKQPVAGLLLSNMARPGVVGFIKTISRELAPENILCNVAAPGYIATDRVTSLLSSRAESSGDTVEEVERGITQNIPMGRIGDPSEFAKAVTFLASDAASYVTGHTMQIDGGLVQGLL
ncbi:MAG: SDR family oxidoreductase [Gemmatimonadetes bacterium]|nr:SDR family oxidoreductase [Gemmatimonadota bacterium]